jgi:hypothetical protein
MRSEIEQLALDIARCSELSTAVIDAKHPCHKIVSAQSYLGTTYRQSPEPWAGDLVSAPVLFIASNPSISESEDVGELYPRTDYATSRTNHPEWSEDNVVDFHINRFDQVRVRPFVTSKAQYLSRDGNYRGSDSSAPGKGSQTYWRNAIKEAKFILGREIDLGHDLCLTEVVHCKTRNEKDKSNKPVGLEEALFSCAGKYLERIVTLSEANMFVISGKVARTAVTTPAKWQPKSQIEWDLDVDRFGQLPKFRGIPSAHLGIASIAGSPRIVCAMRHLSNGYGCGTFEGALGIEGAQALAGLMQSIQAGTETVPKTRVELLKRLGLS